MDEAQKVLREPFVIETHKKTFINYLEIVIDEEGTPMYAVPSHQEKLIAMGCEKLGVNRDQLGDMCPPEYHFDFMEWLCNVTKGIAVWNEHKIGSPNEKQKEVLNELQRNELYRGFID